MNKTLPVVFALSVTVRPVLAWVKVVAAFLRRTNLVKILLLSKLKVPILLKSNFKKMNDLLLIPIVSLTLGILLIIFPASLSAFEIDPLLKESEEHSEMLEVPNPNQMTQKQMNDLFGEDHSFVFVSFDRVLQLFR